jgi:hypothetical protein
MLAFLQVIGILSLLSAISVLIIGLARHFFPSVDELIPDSFKKALTVQASVYYAAIGAALIIVPYLLQR